LGQSELGIFTPLDMNNTEKIRKANHDLLGPLFYRFLFKLYLSQTVYDSSDTILLFLARGGIRIRAFYERFLAANELESPILYSDFYISRMAVIKASMFSNYEAVYQDFLREYFCFSLSKTVSTFFGQYAHDEWVEMPSAGDPNISLDQNSLCQLLWSDTESADYLRRILFEQKELYFEYLNEILGEKKNVIVVDTGWSGSILNYMQGLDKARDYTAQYFGRYNYGKSALPWFDMVVGVEVEDHDFKRKNPVTSVFLNRHLIEGLCEICWPSVTGYQKMENGLLGPIEGLASDESIFPLPEEAQAYGIMKYITEAKDRLDISKIHESGENAARLLCGRLMYPTKDDLIFFSVATRSADFGKDLESPVFMSPIKNIFALKRKLKNIVNSLWPVGQVTLEFPITHRIVQFIYHRRRNWLVGLFRKLGGLHEINS